MALYERHLMVLKEAQINGGRDFTWADRSDEDPLVELRRDGLMDGEQITDLGMEALRHAGWLA